MVVPSFSDQLHVRRANFRLAGRSRIEVVAHRCQRHPLESRQWMVWRRRLVCDPPLYPRVCRDRGSRLRPRSTDYSLRPISNRTAGADFVLLLSRDAGRRCARLRFRRQDFRSAQLALGILFGGAAGADSGWALPVHARPADKIDIGAKAGKTASDS